jgi:hypothetical protein
VCRAERSAPTPLPTNDRTTATAATLQAGEEVSAPDPAAPSPDSASADSTVPAANRIVRCLDRRTRSATSPGSIPTLRSSPSA